MTHRDRALRPVLTAPAFMSHLAASMRTGAEAFRRLDAAMDAGRGVATAAGVCGAWARTEQRWLARHIPAADVADRLAAYGRTMGDLAANTALLARADRAGDRATVERADAAFTALLRTLEAIVDELEATAR